MVYWVGNESKLFGPGWWQFRWLLPDALCILMRSDFVTQQDLQGAGRLIAQGEKKSFLPWAIYVLRRLEGSGLTFKKSAISKTSKQSYPYFYLDKL